MKWWNCFNKKKSVSAYRLIQAKALHLPSFAFAIHSADDEFISRDLARDGIWEPFETQVFGRLCTPGANVLDLGANIGWYTAVASQLVGEQGSVIAFEPDAANYRLLTQNVAQLASGANVATFNAAVSDQQGLLPLYQSDTNKGDHRLFSDSSERATQEVAVTTLDLFFAEHPGPLPDIVKSDTQGSEAKILRGAAGLLDKGWRPVMVLEFWPFGLTRSGDDPMSFVETLESLGYRLFEVSEHKPKLLPLDAAVLSERMQQDIQPDNWGFVNLLCVPAGADSLAHLADLMS
ncbi:FkbM family methyltransferase [Aquipseudomonas alcaligenes]|uniref:Methyltransferase, FkbM family n=1 Tax=Aquipseudomonas alcaligenes TaxID=43263 RepID=A0A1N6N5A8_AQUAC|nr:FkbM family methyltransferase [Pseudomonas alcaligenes]SIP87211.1 methyltransferase, FkbM family [Pseudomonas alcaligenes]